MFDLHNRVAIVTGASSGIGAATARALARHGARVVLAARRVDRISALATEIMWTSGVQAVAVPTDMADRSSIDDLLRRTLDAFGRVDVLVNNAGVGLQGDVIELPERELRQVFDVNVFGPLYAMQAVAPIMRRQRSGVIVNVSSILGKVALPSLGMVGSSAGYTASKFALQAISSAARMELATDGVRVITVLPGVTDTEFNDAFLVSRPSAPRQVRRTGSLMGVTPADKVGERIVHAIEHGGREVYITRKDRFFVWGATLAPGLFEWTMIQLRRARRRR